MTVPHTRGKSCTYTQRGPTPFSPVCIYTKQLYVNLWILYTWRSSWILVIVVYSFDLSSIRIFDFCLEKPLYPLHLILLKFSNDWYSPFSDSFLTFFINDNPYTGPPLFQDPLYVIKSLSSPKVMYTIDPSINLTSGRTVRCLSGRKGSLVPSTLWVNCLGVLSFFLVFGFSSQKPPLWRFRCPLPLSLDWNPEFSLLQETSENKISL